MFRTFPFDLKVASKPFSKMLSITNFELEWSLKALPRFPSSLKNLQKTEKYPFQTLRAFAFELKEASKPFP